MKKRGLSPIELKKVVELGQLGAKWTEIEHETKVERRAAKRAYKEWERDKIMKEQEAVRFRIAAESFHEHLIIYTEEIEEVKRRYESKKRAMDASHILTARKV